MGSIVLRSLSLLLGIFFIYVGIMKLTPYLSKDMHKELRRDFVRFAKIIPFQERFGFKVPSKWYRKIIGTLEVCCGVALVLIPVESIKQMANCLLLLLMAWDVFIHWQAQDRFERIAPSLVFFFMLSCRIIVAYQLRRELSAAKKEIHDKSD